MNNIRKDIVEFLNRPQVTTSTVDYLKSCFELEEGEDINRIDEWLDGFISSLFYRPINKALILCGPHGIGKTLFAQELLFHNKFFSDTRMAYKDTPDVYNHWLVDMSDFDTKYMSKVVNSDGFVINSVQHKINKRLANVIYTTNSIRTELIRKNYIVIRVKSIDIHRFMAIDKYMLWIEIYNNFLSMHSVSQVFNQGDINDFFR